MELVAGIQTLNDEVVKDLGGEDQSSEDLTRLEQENARLRSRAGKSEQDRARWEDANRRSQLEVARYEAERSILDEENTRLRKRITEHNEDKAALDEAIALLRSEAILHRANWARRGEENARLPAQATRDERDRAVLEGEIRYRKRDIGMPSNGQMTRYKRAKPSSCGSNPRDALQLADDAIQKGSALELRIKSLQGECTKLGSEQRDLEGRIRESEERYRDALQLADDAIRKGNALKLRIKSLQGECTKLGSEQRDLEGRIRELEEQKLSRKGQIDLWEKVLFLVSLGLILAGIIWTQVHSRSYQFGEALFDFRLFRWRPF
ncbi:uncharacterized protein EV422DRAFT_30068 [Fimicolochytrium jonesii]|uniref:uncharacterized protein n=1 Tax=Fimicolochytrium jonesii TaxID=1396493 RepID=UPI0022FE7948|nr:uncharacterized protein EV422DRAFT_30068 [Fimicolochytrium jonesii]KAI8827177.1 hypothetical protein EV422DRAFT_30068 [Fimicolochytrium jonesii]